MRRQLWWYRWWSWASELVEAGSGAVAAAGDGSSGKSASSDISSDSGSASGRAPRGSSDEAQVAPPHGLTAAVTAAATDRPGRFQEMCLFPK